MEKERVIELFLGLIFIILVIIMILLFINVQENKSSTTISNSYNTNTYKTYSNYPVQTYNPIKTIYTSTYNPTKSYAKDYNYLRYASTGDSGRYYGFFGNEINEYKVYVKNKEHKGGYFTVKFYLRDYYGKTRTESMTYYLRPHEIKKFVYKNVYSDGIEDHYWKYKVVSNTKI